MQYINRPLVQGLVKFKELNQLSLHVPGHKNGALSGLPESIRTALAYDFTELEGLDDLHQPEGIIEEATQKLTDLYGSDKSFFLVNGSTVGNLAMVYAICREGDTVIVQRNAHKSVFNAIELTGARPVFISPEWDNSTRTAGSVSAEQVRKVLEDYPKAKAVILTYPTYYGVTGEELEESIRLCHERQIPVLVDEAHGAHFVIGKPFPRSALLLGADVVVHSAHKTLPAMTMGSYLHVKSSFVSVERIAHYLQMLQSSSPSYLLMASLDDARAYAESFKKEDIVSFMEKRNAFINELNQLPLIKTITTEDPLKLLLEIEGYSGFDVQRVLDAEKVFVELADPYQVLLVLPLLKKEQSYPFEQIVSKIDIAVQRLAKSAKLIKVAKPPILGSPISTLSYTARELEHLKSDWIPYEQALGKVARASVVPYPPGIPLLLAGERITETHLESLKSLLAMGANFQGAIQVNEEKVFVVINDVEE